MGPSSPQAEAVLTAVDRSALSPHIVHVDRDNRMAPPGETTRAGGALLAEVQP